MPGVQSLGNLLGNFFLGRQGLMLGLTHCGQVRLTGRSSGFWFGVWARGVGFVVFKKSWRIWVFRGYCPE